MIIKIDKFDIIWTYLSKFFKIGQGLILLPLILRFLPTDQIAIWALFSTVTALVNVFDLGFSNVFSRNATQIISGEGIDFQNNEESNTVVSNSNFKKSYNFKKLVVIMKKFYANISLTIFVLLASFGTLYVYHIGKDVTNKHQLYLSWIFLIGSAVLSFFYNYLTIILESKGLIKETQKISVCGMLLAMAFAVTGIFLGWGLIAITFSNFISVIFNRYFLYKMYAREIKPMISHEAFNFDLSYFKEIWSVTYKASIASISSIAIYRSGIIIISLFLPLKEAGMFAFSMNLAFILSEVSFMYFYTHLPQINSLVFHQNNEGLKRIFISSIFMTILSLTAGGFILIFFGNDILSIIGSKMILIPKLPFTFIILILMLDQIQNMATFILFSDNILDYMWSYSISAIVIILTTFLFCKISPSYIAVIFPQLFVQLSYNYWIWPREVFKKLRIKWSDFNIIYPF